MKWQKVISWPFGRYNDCLFGSSNGIWRNTRGIS